jgi:nucleotide-binding universal stress UspA family protein
MRATRRPFGKHRGNGSKDNDIDTTRSATSGVPGNHCWSQPTSPAMRSMPRTARPARRRTARTAATVAYEPFFAARNTAFASRCGSRADRRLHAMLTELTTQIRVQSGVAATSSVEVGDALDEILLASERADVLGLRARGLNPIREPLLVTTAERLLRKCKRPVRVVKQPPAQRLWRCVGGGGSLHALGGRGRVGSAGGPDCAHQRRSCFRCPCVSVALPMRRTPRDHGCRVTCRWNPSRNATVEA